MSADKILQAFNETLRSLPKLSPEKILSMEEQIGDDCKKAPRSGLYDLSVNC